ncbi:MAG: GNAT family N-acetyltransferase [Paracoccaceae bacterium]|nr:GNAT family N-acetyltransferase [Paracoccaceae bacterium]
MITFLAAVSEADQSECRAIRADVFIDEQNVPADLEVDELENACAHYLAKQNDTPIAAARILPKGDKAKIQRVCVAKSHRGTGLGAELMRFVLKEAKAQGFQSAILGSQTYAIPFYEKLGFVAEGPEYLDAGIPHRDMSLVLS